MIKTLSHRISDLQLQLEKLKKELEDSKNNHA
jgi:serine O-acetyltransferase